MTFVPDPEDSQKVSSLQNNSPTGVEDVMIIDTQSGDSVSEFEVPSCPPAIGRGKAFNMSIYQNITPQQVDCLPYDVDGTEMYCININPEEDYKKKYTDGRCFRLTYTSRKGFDGERKIGTCLGNFTCENPECSFFKGTGHYNTHPFTGRQVKFCYSCQCSAIRKPCRAIKCTEYNKASGFLSLSL